MIPRFQLMTTAGLLIANHMVSADIYTFDSLVPDRFIHQQDGWIDQAGQGQAVTALDNTGNGTIVVRHFQTVAFNQSAFITRRNNATFDFLPHSGNETDAVIQFDANGENLAMFALGYDRNGDGVLKGIDGEIGPSFGIGDRKFRIQEAGLGAVYETLIGDGNSGDDWYRFQLRIDFTAAASEGSGSLYYLNLTDGDTVYLPVAGLQNRALGMSRMHADAQPDRWDTMWLHLLTRGGSNPRADNLVPNLNAIRLISIGRFGNDLILNWRGCNSPYQVQQSPDLSAGNWSNFGPPTNSTTITIPIATGRQFFRITRPALP